MLGRRLINIRQITSRTHKVGKEKVSQKISVLNWIGIGKFIMTYHLYNYILVIIQIFLKIVKILNSKQKFRVVNNSVIMLKFNSP